MSIKSFNHPPGSHSDSNYADGQFPDQQFVKGSATGLPKRNDLRPDLKVSDTTISQIIPGKQQIHEASERQVTRIMRSIEAFGLRDLPLLDASLEVIDGHSIVEAAKRLGLKKIKCVIADDLTELEVRTLRIALNKCQERGEWDLLTLKSEFVFLEEFGVDLTVTGFEVSEIDKVLVLDDGVFDENASDKLDQVPALTDEAVTRPGDLWCLGDHRIFCGNARSGADLKALIGGQPVSAVFTDHPFNVPISGHVTVDQGKHPEFAEASGEMSDAEYEDFLKITTGNMADVTKPGGVLFLCIDWRHAEVLMRVVRGLGLELLNMAVWAKHQPGMGSLYRSQHEFVLVAKRPGAPHQNNIQLGKHGRNRSNLWRYAGASGGKKSAMDDFSVHPTVKPVKLVRDAIMDVTSIGDIVHDPFLGSGSTLIAAELSKRICLGVEISPAYVDVAITRWQDMTGFEATHAESGLSFEAVKAERVEAELEAAGECDPQEMEGK